MVGWRPWAYYGQYDIRLYALSLRVLHILEGAATEVGTVLKSSKHCKRSTSGFAFLICLHLGCSATLAHCNANEIFPSPRTKNGTTGSRPCALIGAHAGLLADNGPSTPATCASPDVSRCACQPSAAAVLRCLSQALRAVLDMLRGIWSLQSFMVRVMGAQLSCSRSHRPFVE